MVKRMIWSKLLFVVFMVSAISITSVVYAASDNLDWFGESNDVVKIDYIKSKTVEKTIDESDPLTIETNSDADLVDTIENEAVNSNNDDPVKTSHEVSKDVNQNFNYNKVESDTKINQQSSSTEGPKPKTPSLRFKIGGDPGEPGVGDPIEGDPINVDEKIELEPEEVEINDNGFELMEDYEVESLESQYFIVK